MPKRFLGLSLMGLLVLMSGCGGGGDALPTTASDASRGRSVERLATPWTENGRALTLELVVYRPSGPGPWPTLVFHHGSTGDGTDPATFRQTFESPALAQVFTARGWQVLFPQRRGRGGSDGLYDEGFAADRSRGYACERSPALAGMARALEDVEVIAQAVATRSDVDARRLLLGGYSRGAALALVHAAASGTRYQGVLNFVGGWLGGGCVDALPVNADAARRAAAGSRASLWLYGENDPFYSLSASAQMFDYFRSLGGLGEYHGLRRADPAASGHLIHQEPALWQDVFWRFEERLPRQ